MRARNPFAGYNVMLLGNLVPLRPLQVRVFVGFFLVSIMKRVDVLPEDNGGIVEFIHGGHASTSWTELVGLEYRKRIFVLSKRYKKTYGSCLHISRLCQQHASRSFMDYFWTRTGWSCGSLWILTFLSTHECCQAQSRKHTLFMSGETCCRQSGSNGIDVRTWHPNTQQHGGITTTTITSTGCILTMLGPHTLSPVVNWTQTHGKRGLPVKRYLE